MFCFTIDETLGISILLRCDVGVGFRNLIISKGFSRTERHKLRVLVGFTGALVGSYFGSPAQPATVWRSTFVIQTMRFWNNSEFMIFTTFIFPMHFNTVWCDAGVTLHFRYGNHCFLTLLNVLKPSPTET